MVSEPLPSSTQTHTETIQFLVYNLNCCCCGSVHGDRHGQASGRTKEKLTLNNDNDAAILRIASTYPVCVCASFISYFMWQYLSNKSILNGTYKIDEQYKKLSQCDCYRAHAFFFPALFLHFLHCNDIRKVWCTYLLRVCMYKR